MPRTIQIDMRNTIETLELALAKAKELDRARVEGTSTDLSAPARARVTNELNLIEHLCRKAAVFVKDEFFVAKGKTEHVRAV